jgi:hypothetical protein
MSGKALIEVRGLLASGATEPEQRDGRTEIRITSTGDLVRIVECAHRGSYQYRGQDSASWVLLPKLTREGGPIKSGLGANETWKEKEHHILSEFRNRAPRYEHNRDLTTVGDLELAIWAQHHGVPTRLVDWTLNPLAALYFAVENEKDEYDAAVWAIAGDREFLANLPRKGWPKADAGIQFFMSPRFFHRSATQASILAVWSDPRRQLDDPKNSPGNLWKIIVPKDARHCIRWSLHCLGIDRETLFPDMDGLGRYLTWKHGRVHQERYEEQCIPAPRTQQ